MENSRDNPVALLSDPGEGSSVAHVPRLVRISRFLAHAARFIGGITLYLAATLFCVVVGWLLPGRGIDTIVARLVLGCTAPAAAVLLLQAQLRRRRLTSLAIALLVGMICVGVACFVGAVGVVVGFRMLKS